MSRGVPISVVIRTLNAASTLPNVLAGLQRHEGDELIVVDSGSSDETVAIAEAAKARVLRIPQAEFSFGRALNRGFASATNEWVLSLSSHCIPMPVRRDHLRLFREAVERHADQFAAAVGPFHNSELDRVLMGGITFYTLEDFAHGFGFPAGNPNCLYRRSLWEEHPFDEEAESGEDYEWYLWALRKGHAIAAVHAASARYASARPMKALYRKGRFDRRYAVKLQLGMAPVGMLEVLIHSAKLLAFWLLGRISWASVRNGVAYKLGAWVEGRSETAPLPKSDR